MLVPITVNLGFADRKFIETLPSELRVVLEQEGQKCLYDTMPGVLGDQNVSPMPTTMSANTSVAAAGPR